MIVEKNKVIEFDYRLTDANGQLLEETAGSQPLAYLHGHGNILAALEASFEGHVVGDHISVEITPEQGFGHRDESLVQRIPIKHLDFEGRLAPGTLATVNTREGPRQVVVSKVGRFNVDADLNHPFAGLTLNFVVELVSIRDATPEERAHGHAHGPGGHSHD